MIVVLDTAGVDAVLPADARGRARLRALRRQAHDLVLPAAVPAEGLFTGHPGHDHHVRALLGVLSIAPVDGPIGLAAGDLRVGAIRDGTSPPPSGVDAIVAAVADEHAGRDEVHVLTGDTGDLTALLAHGRRPERIAVTPV